MIRLSRTGLGYRRVSIKFVYKVDAKEGLISKNIKIMYCEKNSLSWGSTATCRLYKKFFNLCVEAGGRRG